MSASKRRPVDIGQDGGQFAIHLTPASNLASIAAYGLLPSIGPLSKLDGEKTPLIHFYGTVTQFSTDLLQWMGSILASPGEDGRAAIALLAVDISHTGCGSHRNGDYACPTVINPGCLDVVCADLSSDVDIDEMMDDYCERRFTAKTLGQHSESSWRELTMTDRLAQMLEAGSVRRTFVLRRGQEAREDVAQESLFPMERPIPRY